MTFLVIMKALSEAFMRAHDCCMSAGTARWEEGVCRWQVADDMMVRYEELVWCGRILVKRSPNSPTRVLGAHGEKSRRPRGTWTSSANNNNNNKHGLQEGERAA